ncbi:diguanylate cyclase (GGDEF)-like protein [Oxalobacteraceae bacterium GrIS 1.18]
MSVIVASRPLGNGPVCPRNDIGTLQNMRTNAHCFDLLRIWFAGFALFCAFLPNSEAGASPGPEMNTEVFRIQDLAETKIADAIRQLVELKQHLPASATVDDQRLVLSALITLYLSDDRHVLAQELTGELGELAKRYDDNYSRTLMLNFQARMLSDQGKFDAARQTIEQALQLAKKVNDKNLTRTVSSNASIIYSELGDFNVALQYQLAAIQLLESKNKHDDLLRIKALNIIGTIYLDLKDPKSALENFDQGARLAESVGAQNSLATLTLNRGAAFTDLERHQDAISAYLEAQKIARNIADRRSEAYAVNNLSDTYYRLNNFEQCLRYAKQTAELAEKLASEDLQTTAMINVGLCQMGLGEVVVGARQVEQGIVRLRKGDAKTQVEPVLGQFAAAYAKAGMYREAYKQIVEQLALSTELFKSDRDRAVSEMRAKYDASERQKQIEVLEQKNQVQSAEIKNKGLQRVIAILSTVIAATVAIIILYLYRRVREANRNLEEANVKLAHQSTRDPLTGLFNRRAFHDAMKFRTQLSDRRSSDNISPPHALVMLDIDHFKRINDTYGHASGDAVLIEFSKRLSDVMRDQDMLMRWGGEEFLIFLSHIPAANLPLVVERILISCGGQAVEFEQKVIHATISAGYISLPMGVDSEVDPNWEKMLNLADSALYMAKTRGRNQAIGINVVGVKQEDLDELLEGNLENSITQGRVTIAQIPGPVQKDNPTEYV